MVVVEVVRMVVVVIVVVVVVVVIVVAVVVVVVVVALAHVHRQFSLTTEVVVQKVARCVHSSNSTHAASA